MMLHAADLHDVASIGGKAASLARLAGTGHRVPEWFVIPEQVQRRVCTDPALQAAMEQARELVVCGDDERASLVLDAAIAAVDFPDDVIDRIKAWYRKLDGGGDAIVAVRSSAADEDGDALSFAGQFESTLGVVGIDAIIAAVRRTWASAFSARVLAYRRRHGRVPLDGSMAVIVQKMVMSDMSGIAFSGDPITGDPYTSVISAAFGVGELIVSGEIDADTVRVDRRDASVTYTAARKDVSLQVRPNGEMVRMELTEPACDARALDGRQVVELHDALLDLEREYACPVDIEWSYERGVLYILQVRPITSALRPRGKRRTWDNSNIVESYSGVVSPLTFSFARTAYQAVYEQFTRLLRVPEAQMSDVRIATRQMLGYIDGHVYYNLHSWYYLLSLVPGYERNQKSMEQMMGVREALDGNLAPPANAIRGIRVKLVVLWALATIRWKKKAFRANLAQMFARYDVDLSRHDADQLVDAYDDLAGNLLTRWQAPLIGDFRVMMMFDRLRSTIADWGIDDTGTLLNDLLCGQGGLESAEPTYQIIAIAELIRTDERLARVVNETPSGELRDALERYASTEALQVCAMIDDYIARFGDRCANELKLETPTLREDPAYLHRLIRQYAADHELTQARMRERESTIRATAERTAHEQVMAMKWKRSRWLLFRMLVGVTRTSVRDREAMRFDRTRVFGVARRIFVALGHRLHEVGLIERPDDIFYLEVAEAVGAVQGTVTTGDLAALVAIRRADAELWKAHDLPERIRTVGITSANPKLDAYDKVEHNAERISGIGCCAGTVERPARIVESPDSAQDLNGDIMVCRRTDPGWVPLFPTCGGILVERGSLLSHSAIVAREFGIPAIVGIPGLLDWISDGETVSMDGSTGTVSRPKADSVGDHAEDDGTGGE